jgi:hypothetical protein
MYARTAGCWRLIIDERLKISGAAVSLLKWTAAGAVPGCGNRAVCVGIRVGAAAMVRGCGTEDSLSIACRIRAKNRHSRFSGTNPDQPVSPDADQRPKCAGFSLKMVRWVTGFHPHGVRAARAGHGLGLVRGKCGERCRSMPIECAATATPRQTNSARRRVQRAMASH